MFWRDRAGLVKTRSSILSILFSAFKCERSVKAITKAVTQPPAQKHTGLDQDTLIIDTPGIRQIGLIRVDTNALLRYFPEFIGYNSVCRYSDCKHIHEPDCGVKLAVNDGHIPVQRYESYRKLAAELGSDKGSV